MKESGSALLKNAAKYEQHANLKAVLELVAAHIAVPREKSLNLGHGCLVSPIACGIMVKSESTNQRIIFSRFHLCGSVRHSTRKTGRNCSTH